MDKGLKELLESDVLSEETKAILEKAFENKLEAAKAEVREDFRKRYEQDKANLVEAMDRMLTDAVKEQEAKTFEAIQALKAEKTALSNTVKESRAALKQKISESKTQYAALMAEHIEKIEKRVEKALYVEMLDLRRDRKRLAEATASRMKMFEEFAVGQLSRELTELHEDHKDLNRRKVQFVAESRAQLKATKKEFLERASAVVEAKVSESLYTEMKQLKQELKEARENTFGRRLFEAFQTEFLTSHLSEGTAVRQLTRKLAESEKAIAATKKALIEQKALVENNQRKLQISEEKAARAQALGDLLAPLSKEKRAVMGELLENVKTVNLKSAFTKYLPTVLNETRNVSRQALSEVATNGNTIAITGNRSNRLATTAQTDDEATAAAELTEIRRLAGIEK